MLTLLKNINHKINGLIWAAISTGIVLMMLAVLIVWTDFMLRLVMGLIVIIIAYAFLYAGYKLWALKRDITNRYEIFRDLKELKKDYDKKSKH